MAAIKTVTATVTTTSTSATTLWTIDSSTIAVWAKVFKYRNEFAGGRDLEAFMVEGIHYTTTEVAEVTTSTEVSNTGAGGTVAFVTNGSNNIELQVTAASTDTTTWIAEISYIDENA